MRNILEFVIEGVLIPVVSICGLGGNLISIIVLLSSKLDMKWSFRCLLVMLAVFDTIFVICITISFSPPQLWTSWKHTIHPNIFPWLLPFLQMALNGSTWSIVAVAIERVTSILVPHRSRLLSSPVLTYILPVVALTTVWNIPRFSELYTCLKPQNNIQGQVIVSPERVTNEQPSWLIPNEEEINETAINSSLSQSMMLSICPTELRSNVFYTQYYILIGNFVIMVFLPFVLLTILNGYLYKVIISKRFLRSSSRQSRDQNIAMILVTIVIIFFVCSIPRVVINTYEVFHLLVKKDLLADWPEWCDTVTVFSHLLLTINSSINIVIYTARDDKFRNILAEMIGMKKKVGQKKVIKRNRLISDTTRLSALFSGQETDSSRDVQYDVDDIEDPALARLTNLVT